MHHAIGLILPSTSLHDPASIVPSRPIIPLPLLDAGLNDLHTPHICP